MNADHDAVGTPPDPRFEPIHSVFAPVTLRAIRRFEERLEARLPLEYVAFLSRYGGCGFSGTATVTANEQVLEIFKFFGEHELVANLDTYPDLTAEKQFTFADDMTGNPFVLDALSGRVCFLDFWMKSPPIGTRVADSFEAFLASIRVDCLH